MSSKKQYCGTTDDFEKKLGRVMDRLGAEHFQCDWNQKKGGASCFVEMRYNGRTYRFENSTEKSAACGRNLIYVSDLLAAVVYSLEGLARAVEQGIFTLDMLLAGVPALPAAPPVEPCFRALGFTEQPESVEAVKQQYKRMAQVMHPDKGGSDEAFASLVENYNACMEAMGGAS